MKSVLLVLTASLLLIVCCCHRQAVRQNDSLPSLTAQTTRESQLTLAGSKPFYLKATVLEATNPGNDSYKAEIEEYWAAPDKWRRIIRAGTFSSETVVNGAKQSHSVSGEYYPNWLRTIVTAIFDSSLPMRRLDLTVPSDDNPMPGSGLLCRRYPTRVGTLPAINTVYSTVCFDGDKLESLQLPGFNAEYKKYKGFNAKQVARTIREYIEPGTELEATITELTELAAVDESMFAVAEPTPNPLQTLTVSEDTIRKLAKAPLDLKWPPTRGGKTEGMLSIYVCFDRSGNVRETYELNSDNAGMSEAAQQQLSKISFTPLNSADTPVQFEGILTFAYKTVISNPYPELTEEQARERIISLVEPSFPGSISRGTVATVSVLVGDDGKVQGADIAGPAGVGWPDLERWAFQPLIRDGKPTAFKAVLRFVAP